ncbi:MAG TPA: glycosyltransferase family 2 protein [Flavobacteriales bacterium]|nr:glycosyltransferase family 2 protein [Flavobacteriales bacterium]HRJ36144.1 glycosyltransferase family 2 protein [Flavobacteriales bacterium]HRJ37718.1 glycosyltransferase family 2 protein [Flavobacteriales bacterium]
MKTSGFTFIRNAIIYDYPIVEAIQSILPLCDEVVVAVGKSEDDTLGLIKGIASEKIRIVETVWDDSLREGGRVLAEETNKAYAAIAKDADWAIYIQGDEVLHEAYIENIRAAMLRFKDDEKVDGLLLNYLHFYGSYDYVGSSPNWYRKEIRVVRNRSSIYSYRDAQGFRKGEDEKLNVIPVDAWMYHYGWVKDPRAMQKKQEEFNKLWHDDAWVKQHVVKADAFDYGAHVRELRRFTGKHPVIMQQRIAAKNWTFDHDISMNKKTMKDRFKQFVLDQFGWDISYKNYREIRG